MIKHSRKIQKPKKGSTFKLFPMNIEKKPEKEHWYEKKGS